MEITIADSGCKYTKSDLKIINYIEGNTEQFLFMSICELAKTLNISEATISRFVRHIGYTDFKDMKSGIIKQKSGKGPAGKLAGTLLKDKGFDVRRWLEYQAECLEKTMEQTGTEEFNQSVAAIMEAEHIYIHGKNASASMAQLLFFRLRRLGLNVFLIPSGGSEVIEGIAHAGKKDVVLEFSFSKLSSEGRAILDYAVTAGYKTIAFTGRAYVPREQRADINIYVYRGEEDEYHSMTSAAAMIDAMVLSLSEKMEGVSADRLNKVHSLKKQYRDNKK